MSLQEQVQEYLNINPPVSDFWYKDGVTDMERKYRKEWEANFKNLIPGYWKEGRFISAHIPDKGFFGGYTVEIWQLDQHMHFLRVERNLPCFPGCEQCKRHRSIETKENLDLEEKGRPFPEEIAGQYPCPEVTCAAVFNYKSQLLRHLEKLHGRKINWNRYCDICCWEPDSKTKGNPEWLVRSHRSKLHNYPMSKDDESNAI